MKKIVLIALTDGFADWEASYVSAEINQPHTQYQVKTIAIDNEPKMSMGGFRVLPDYELNAAPEIADVSMLIIPGGTGWGEEHNQTFRTLVGLCLSHDVPVAAICDATSFLGNHGFMDNHKHTGNMLANLKNRAPGYKGERHYIDAQSVSDGNLITANGSAAVEFSRHILEKLGVLEGDKLEEWYSIFKKGYLPSS